ncbi:MAG: hypothetical protein GY869_00395, partial [Planctomycetes bacterium]|nr:hypothetical protein [Planctomycetota bacterium]
MGADFQLFHERFHGEALDNQGEKDTSKSGDQQGGPVIGKGAFSGQVEQQS